MMKPAVLRDVLPADLFLDIHKEQQIGWSLGNHETYGYGATARSWGKIEREVCLPLIFQSASIINLKIQRILKRRLRFTRAHFNAQTNGQGVGFHTDFDEPDVWTFVLFTELSWDTSWGGEFVCLNPNTNEYDYVAYRPNCGVLIPADWDHCGRSPNVLTQQMRTSIGYSFCDSRYGDELLWKHGFGCLS